MRVFSPSRVVTYKNNMQISQDRADFYDFTGDATKPLFLGAKMAFKTVDEFHLRAGKLQII